MEVSKLSKEAQEAGAVPRQVVCMEFKAVMIMMTCFSTHLHIVQRYNRQSATIRHFTRPL